VCVATPGGDPNHMTDDLISHLLVDHHGGQKPDANISFLLFSLAKWQSVNVHVLCWCLLLQSYFMSFTKTVFAHLSWAHFTVCRFICVYLCVFCVFLFHTA